MQQLVASIYGPYIHKTRMCKFKILNKMRVSIWLSPRMASHSEYIINQYFLSSTNIDKMKLIFNEARGPFSLTWFNFNPSIDK